MKNSAARSGKEEIREKLAKLYSDSFESGRNVLDFDRKYDFFSMNESLVLKYSSNWFRPEKYSCHVSSGQSIKHYQSLCHEEAGGASQRSKQESLLRTEKGISSGSNLTRDLEILGRTPYQIGVDGEKFRVVAATLQKCNSPFVRRTFHFTSNGIVEASERKEEFESASLLPVPTTRQAKGSIGPQQKFVRIRRFRVIKKEDLPLEKYVLPQKIKITSGEKTRFLTVRIRSRNCAGETARIKAEGNGRTETAKDGKSEPEAQTTNASSAVQTEEPEEAERSDPNGSESDVGVIGLGGVPEEEESDERLGQIRQGKPEEAETETERENEVGETAFNCENCGKQFSSYLTCLAHVRSHQRQACQMCQKRFLTAKMLRDHVRIQHQGEAARSNLPEDRITTATSKFGRTRQVLNVAGLRSKYRML